MFFRRHKDVAIQLVEFVRLNSTKAYKRFKENLDENNISENKFIYEFLVFSLFTIDYSCTVFIKDERKNTKLLHMFYSELATTFKEGELYNKLTEDINIYAVCARESNEDGDMIQKITFKFSRQLLDDVDLFIAMKAGIEFVEIGKITKDILTECRLL